MEEHWSHRPRSPDEMSLMVQQEMSNLQALKRLSIGSQGLVADPDLPDIDIESNEDWSASQCEQDGLHRQRSLSRQSSLTRQSSVKRQRSVVRQRSLNRRASNAAPILGPPLEDPVDDDSAPPAATREDSPPFDEGLDSIWVPAGLHPELSPNEWQAFVDEKLIAIRNSKEAQQQSRLSRHPSRLSHAVVKPEEYADASAILDRRRRSSMSDRRKSILELSREFQMEDYDEPPSTPGQSSPTQPSQPSSLRRVRSSKSTPPQYLTAAADSTPAAPELTAGATSLRRSTHRLHKPEVQARGPGKPLRPIKPLKVSIAKAKAMATTAEQPPSPSAAAPSPNASGMLGYRRKMKIDKKEESKDGSRPDSRAEVSPTEPRLEISPTETESEPASRTKVVPRIVEPVVEPVVEPRTVEPVVEPRTVEPKIEPQAKPKEKRMSDLRREKLEVHRVKLDVADFRRDRARFGKEDLSRDHISRDRADASKNRTSRDSTRDYVSRDPSKEYRTDYHTDYPTDYRTDYHSADYSADRSANYTKESFSQAPRSRTSVPSEEHVADKETILNHRKSRERKSKDLSARKLPEVAKEPKERTGSDLQAKRESRHLHSSTEDAPAEIVPPDSPKDSTREAEEIAKTYNSLEGKQPPVSTSEDLSYLSNLSPGFKEPASQAADEGEKETKLWKWLDPKPKPENKDKTSMKSFTNLFKKRDAKKPKPEERSPVERGPDERSPDERSPDERSPDERSPEERSPDEPPPQPTENEMPETAIAARKGHARNVSRVANEAFGNQHHQQRPQQQQQRQHQQHARPQHHHSRQHRSRRHSRQHQHQNENYQQQQQQQHSPDQPEIKLPYDIPAHQVSDRAYVMMNHRFPLHIERAIYRLSHMKLANPRQPLRQQVLLSNFMYAYLNLINYSYQQQQLAQYEEQKVQSGGALGSLEIEQLKRIGDKDYERDGMYGANHDDVSSSSSSDDEDDTADPWEADDVPAEVDDVVMTIY